MITDLSLMKPLVDKLPFGRRIEYLFEHPQICSRHLGDYRFNKTSFPITPNCHGTTLFVLEAEKRILEKANKLKRINGSKVIDESYSNFAFFPNELDGPGYLQTKFMRNFLDQCCVEANEVFLGDIVSFSGGDGISYVDPKHTAIYVGNLNGVDWIFHKRSKNKGIEFTTIDEIVSDKYESDLKYYRYNNNSFCL